jgi:hypothetical protein
MKSLYTTASFICIIFFSLTASAQEQKVQVNQPDLNKPKLFASLPDKIVVSNENLTNLFTSSIGRSVNVDIAGSQLPGFEGEVISTTSKYENSIQSMVIRSTNYNGARLTISKITNADGTVTYSGRIISLQHDDVYELQKEAAGFVLVKRKLNDLLNE